MDKALEHVPHGHCNCCCEGISVAPRKNEDKRERDGREAIEGGLGFGTVFGFLDITQNVFTDNIRKEEMMMITSGTRGQ